VVLGAFITQELFNLTTNPVLAFLMQIVVLTAILLLFGEIMPKVYAAHSSYKFASFMARPLILLRKLLSPLSTILVSSTNAIDKRMKKKSHEITMDDINSAIDLTRNNKQTPEENEEQKILKGIAKFGDIEVREVMKSRMDVVSIEESEDYHEVLKIIKQSGYSRIPVYRDSFDNIQGVIYIKDFLGNLNEEKDFNWNSMIRPAFFVPENKKISDLLLEFQDKKIHLAIVVDEYGGTSGIVTMEDVIEEIVGEIVDEFDVDDSSFIYKKIAENEYLFEGKVSLNDFCKTMNVDDRIFEEERGDADTLAGFILEKIGQIPEKGTQVEHEKFTFIVQNVSDRRITRIKVKINE
jgi:gliding motility-associated protein GldE